jgi:hypothetical protein
MENGKGEFKEKRHILALLAAPCKDLYIREEDVHGTGLWEKGERVMGTNLCMYG